MSRAKSSLGIAALVARFAKHVMSQGASVQVRRRCLWGRRQLAGNGAVAGGELGSAQQGPGSHAAATQRRMDCVDSEGKTDRYIVSAQHTQRSRWCRVLVTWAELVAVGTGAAACLH